MELILIILCCWQLYRLANNRALTGWKWVLNFVGGYFAFGVLLGIAFVFIYGQDIMKNMKILTEKLLEISPFVYLFIVLWFLFLRSRILQYEEMDNDETDEGISTPEPPVTPKSPAASTDKKDLSYFR